MNTPHTAEVGEMNSGALKSKWSLYTKFKDTSRAVYQWMVGVDSCVTDSGQWADIFLASSHFQGFSPKEKRWPRPCLLLFAFLIISFSASFYQSSIATVMLCNKSPEIKWLKTTIIHPELEVGDWGTQVVLFGLVPSWCLDLNQLLLFLTLMGLGGTRGQAQWHDHIQVCVYVIC